MTPPARPISKTIFTSRPKDRITEVTKPWRPEDIARALRLAEEGDLSVQADMFEHMVERDAELSGYMQTRILVPGSMEWAVMPRDDSPEAKAAAEKCDEILKGIPNMRGVLLRMADAIGKGMSCLEIDWRDDKTISGIRWIHPKRYRFDWQSETFMIVPDNPAEEWKPVPIDRSEFKFIIHRPQLRATHPARGGVLRTIVWAFLFRNYTLKDWVTFSEVFGMPLRIGKYPPGSKDSDKDELRQALEMLGTDAFAIVDSRVILEYTESTNRGMHPGDALFAAMGRQYQISILGQDQTSTHNDAGGRTQVQFGGAPIRQDLIVADCEDIQSTAETDLLYPIVGYNLDWGIASRVCPVFKLFYEPDEDYQKYALTDETVHLKFGLPTTWGEIAKRYGRELPEGIDPETFVFFNEYVPPGFESRPHVIITTSAVTGQSTEQRVQAKEDMQKKLDAAAAAAGGGGDNPPGGSQDSKPGLKALPGGKAGQSMLAAFTLLAQSSVSTKDMARLLSPEQAEIDAKTEALVPRAAAAMRQLAGPVLSVIATSDSLEEINQRLTEIYPEMDEGEIERLLRHAWYVSRLFGQAVAEFRAKD